MSIKISHCAKQELRDHLEIIAPTPFQSNKKKLTNDYT